MKNDMYKTFFAVLSVDSKNLEAIQIYINRKLVTYVTGTIYTIKYVNILKNEDTHINLEIFQHTLLRERKYSSEERVNMLPFM